MPQSSSRGKKWMREKALSVQPSVILDVGPGRGTYRALLDADLPNCFWIGVEIFEPYVRKYRLHSKYDEVIVADIRTMDWDQIGRVDLTIMGDVLEHMAYEEAQLVWEAARRHSKHVLLSIPIGLWEQGESGGNAHEAHVSSWSVEDCLSLSGISDYKVHGPIGTFFA